MKNAAVLLHLEIDDNATREQLILDIRDFIAVKLKSRRLSCIQKVIGFELHSVQIFNPDKGRVT